jgi:hypothetical protein
MVHQRSEPFTLSPNLIQSTWIVVARLEVSAKSLDLDLDLYDDFIGVGYRALPRSRAEDRSRGDLGRAKARRAKGEDCEADQEDDGARIA